MDELPEFRRNVLEVLRQPMEGRMMTISRAKFSIDYPASFMLVASMNPCPVDITTILHAIVNARLVPFRNIFPGSRAHCLTALISRSKYYLYLLLNSQTTNLLKRVKPYGTG
jgi:magnesium chelatase family protein